MPIQSKVVVQPVEDDIFLRISILTEQNDPIDEFTCIWKDFFDFSQKVSVVEGASERTIEEDDHKHSEKLESFLNAAFESKITSSVSVTHSFFLLRLRQAEKIHFQRISELSIMEEKISRLESDNVALQHVVMDLISTVDSLKSRLVSIEKNGIAPPLEVNPYLEDGNNSKDDIDGQSTQSSVIISDSDPCLKMYPRFEREMDEFVRMIQPREAQISFRQEAAMIMKSLIQKALKCNAFVISFSELKCFLPDDPIRLTVVLNHAALSTWHKILYDRLVILSEQHEIRTESSLMPLDQSEMMFKIRDVRLISEADTFKISGLMDNLPFEIVGNGRVDLTMLAFFEEVGALVGNDHLLKRSVLLIRAWWWYESMADGEKSPREYLPDSALWLMTAALFNVYHRLIVDPVQALYLFLRIYGSFDGRKEVVTLYGLKRIPDNASHCVIERDDREYLIPAKLFEKYYNVVNVTHDANPNTVAVPPVQQWKADNSSLVILNPFTMETITLEKLSSRKVEKIQAIFKQGLSNLKQSFDDMSGKRNSLTSLVFPLTMRAMLSGLARRDTAASSRQGAMSIDYLEMMKSPRDVYYVEVSQIWHEILFCNFILQGIVSESALLSLCAEVLTERRILPVGEVGKIVSDIVASPFLSSQLKEKFGGLKKFLEKYPEIFVFSKDHPFNPHVVLKRFLSAEQLEMVEAGTSLQAIFKAANRQLQQQQQQQQQHGGGNRHANNNSYGIPEAVQVGKKALQNRHNGNNMNRHDMSHRYDVNNSINNSLFSAAMNGNASGGNDFALSANASPFNLDLSWKQPPMSSFGSNSSWNSHNDAYPSGSGMYGGGGGGGAIPRLRGVDENFSSRYRSPAPDSYSGLTSSASSVTHSMFDAQPPQPSYGLFGGSNNSANSILNSPQSQQYSRGQQQQQQQQQSGDSFFSYS